MARNQTRSLVEIDANRIDRDIYHLAARIDRLCELVSRGKPKMNRELIDAARSVDSARAAVRKFMHEADRVVTVG
jgi:hypothetical protein